MDKLDEEERSVPSGAKLHTAVALQSGQPRSFSLKEDEALISAGPSWDGQAYRVGRNLPVSPKPCLV